ncbi:MAG: T9SS type A sorting domain-containing protein [Flavobacteriales bacterium]
MSGGVGPYTLLWNTGSTQSCINSLPPGSYSITVTDFMGEVATADFELNSSPLPGTSGEWVPGCPLGTPFGGPPYRLFLQTGMYSTGMPPFDVSDGSSVFWQADPEGGFLEIYNLPPSGTPTTINISDGNGCTSTVNTTIPQPPQWLVPQVLDVNGACSGGSNGSIRVYVPQEPSGWASAFRLHNGSNYVTWTNIPQNNPDAFQAGYINREFIAQGLPAGTYKLVQYVSWEHYNNPFLEQWYPDAQLQAECPDTLATIEVPDLGFTCGTLSGRVFIDPNENCSFGSGDVNLTNTVIEVQPGGYVALTNATGQYSINLPNGTYTVADQNPLYQEHCGVEGTPFDITPAAPNITRNLADTSLAGLDVEALIGSGAARPGFEVLYTISSKNLTGVNGGSGTVTYTYDPTLIYLNANPAPASVVGNTITWNFSSLNALTERYFRPRFQVPPDIGLLGVDLASSASVVMVNNEANTTNNTVEHVVTITGAYDPNDKLARTSMGNTSTWLINEDEWIDYTIRFQNTGTDTAFFVVITDTLPANLDAATFQRGVGSHGHYVTLQGQGVIRWMFPNILLPDSNVNEPLSHGFVTFRIRPHLPLLPGDEIENIANIYFDFNPPVITESSVLVATTGTGVREQRSERVQLHPNPTRDLLWITSEWTIDAITIHAADGREVMRRSLRDLNASIDVSELRSGAYFVVAEMHSGGLSHARFIKQ